MKENGKVLLDEVGYEKIVNTLNNLKERQIRINQITEFISDEERAIQGSIIFYEDLLNRVEVIEKHNDENIIDLEDIVEVDKLNENGLPEHIIFKLVGGVGDVLAEIPEITVNSPLGQAVYKRRINEQVHVKTKEESFEVLILGKLSLNMDDSAPTNERK